MPESPHEPDFYQCHYRDYFKRTVSVDPALFLTPFIRHLKKGAAVLDVGCGSGRDLLWLKERGFKATGIERASGLAELAKGHSGCEVIAGDFENLDFSGFTVDAVMACGSLVHVPHERLAGLLKRMLRALTAGGVIYISLKQGRRTKSDHFDRVFYLWETDQLDDIWQDLGLTVLNCSHSQSALNSKDDWLSYVLGLNKIRG